MWSCNKVVVKQGSTIKSKCNELCLCFISCRIHKFMDYFARDIVGMSAYDFYHGNDVAVIQGHHAKCKNLFWTD